jgi:hypothetical protein
MLQKFKPGDVDALDKLIQIEQHKTQAKIKWSYVFLH